MPTPVFWPRPPGAFLLQQQGLEATALHFLHSLGPLGGALAPGKHILFWGDGSGDLKLDQSRSQSFGSESEDESEDLSAKRTSFDATLREAHL